MAYLYAVCLQYMLFLIEFVPVSVQSAHAKYLRLQVCTIILISAQPGGAYFKGFVFICQKEEKKKSNSAS